MTDRMFYICDVRPEWRSKRYITFWRPENAGYAFPLSWAGQYALETIRRDIHYYLTIEGRRVIRFPVLCEIVDAMAVPPRQGDIDGDAGPVVEYTVANRRKLVAARYRERWEFDE